MTSLEIANDTLLRYSQDWQKGNFDDLSLCGSQTAVTAPISCSVNENVFLLRFP